MPSTSRHRWFHRERLSAFAAFLWQRFLDDRCPRAAGALAYTTLFALVPLTAAVLGVLSAFPVFQQWRNQISDFVFDNFVPSAGRAVQAYFVQFADNASQATVVGVLLLLFSALALMMSIEDAFNRIWRVATPRRAGARFLVFWAALSLGPLLLVAALAISSYLFALPLLEQVESGFGFKTRLLGALPFLIAWLALTASYCLIPNRSVRLLDAALGALFAALLFEAAKRGFGLYVGHVVSYERVYGTLAVFPIFLVWIYLSWLVVLLGASLTAAATAFEYRSADERLPPGQEFVGLLCVVERLVAAQREGRGLHSSALREALPFLDGDALQGHLAALHGADLARRTESGEWLLSRDPASATLARAYELGRYRAPLDAGALPPDCDPAPQWRRRLRGELAATLATPLSAIFPAALRSGTSLPTEH